MNVYGKSKWTLIIALLAVVLVLLMILVIGLDNGKFSPETEQTPEQSTSAEAGSNGLEILDIQEEKNDVIVTTSYCVVKYPYAFSDLVQVETINRDEKTALCFYTVLNETKMPLYELVFEGMANIPLGTITVGKSVMGVSAIVHAPATTLEGDVRLAFVAAQETFHDVVLSLEENANFVPTA